jgi:glutaredoxin
MVRYPRRFVFVSNIPDIIVYSLENCPNCEILKGYLKGRGTRFEVRDMQTAQALTELRIAGVFVREAPVLRVGTRYLTTRELFSSGEVNEATVGPLLQGERA